MRILKVVVGLMFLLSALGCGAYESSCDCDNPDVVLWVPFDLTPTAIRVSGACDGSAVRCGPTGFVDDNNVCESAEYYLILPMSAGSCHIEVDLTSQPTFVTDVPIEDRGAGCCGNLYPAPGYKHVNVTAGG